MDFTKWDILSKNVTSIKSQIYKIGFVHYWIYQELLKVYPVMRKIVFFEINHYWIYFLKFFAIFSNARKSIFASEALLM